MIDSKIKCLYRGVKYPPSPQLLLPLCTSSSQAAHTWPKLPTFILQKKQYMGKE